MLFELQQAVDAYVAKALGSSRYRRHDFGTPENRGRSPLFLSPSLPAGWQNNTTEVVS
jgi:hypothetical protein